MPSLHQLNVSLTPELDQFVRSRVAAGLYVTSSEVVREALRLLQQREREADEAIAELKAMLQRAEEQIRRGEVHTADEVFAAARARILEVHEQRTRAVAS
jgi:antitoxin ParD1/3/4